MSKSSSHMLKIDTHNAIHVIHVPPKEDNATFVFLNSMGASTDAWEGEIAPALRAKGFGTLSFDYRGQGKSKYGEDAKLDPAGIIDDIVHVFAEEKPHRPIMIGLSIGGLFGAWALSRGVTAEGIVLINTLRKPSALIDWINELEARLIAMGGMPLTLDVLRPVLSGQDQLERLRSTHLPQEGYSPWPADHPRRRLAEQVHKADWSFPWDKLTAPALILTGMHDRLFRIQSDVDELVGRIPDAQVVNFPDGGHSLQAEHPARFVAHISGFALKLKAQEVET